VKDAKHRAVVINGGADWGDMESDESDPGYMGTHAVGNNCHARFRKRVSFGKNRITARTA
jgi:hypothetical protein